MDETMQEIFKHPVTTQAFAFLRRENRSIGVREMQKQLNLGSSSTSHYHLSKLVQLGVASQNADNSYILVEPYASIKEIPLPVVLDHYLVGGTFRPKISLIIAFQTIMVLAIMIMLAYGMHISAALAGLLTVIISTVMLLRFFRSFNQPHTL